MRVEGDIVFFKWVGNFLPEDVGELHAHMEGMLAEHTFIFLLVDATASGLIMPQARREAASWPYLHRLGGAAIFGAGLTTRTLVTLTLAIRNRLFSQGSAMPAVKFVNTEQAARAWIAARRRQIASEGNRPP